MMDCNTLRLKSLELRQE